MEKEKMIHNSRLFSLFIFVGLFACLFLIYSNSIYASEDDKKNVLFISSYSESFITVPEQIKGLQSVFQGKNINLEIEYMDAKRFSSEENILSFYERLKYKLTKGIPYDAIIVGDDAALQFAMDYQGELFVDTPIVFFGINSKERAIIADAKPNMVGSLEETSLEENIKIALRFNPDAKRVVAIVDSTLTGQGDEKQFDSSSKEFQNLEFEVLNVSNYSYDEFGKILEKIDHDTILLFLSMNQDMTSQYLDLDKQFQFIKEHTKVPVYRASVGGVGEGLIGGKMISYEEFGRNAANIVIDIFLGKSIESFTLDEKTPYYYFFDYDLIQKYNIDKTLIPKGSILLNKEIHPLEKYKKYIVAVGAFVFVLSILALILIVDNIKRRKIQKELHNSHEELIAIYEELAASEEELKIQYNVIEENSIKVNTLYKKYEIAIKSTDSAVWELNLETKEVEISKNFESIIHKSILTEMNVFTMLDEFIHPDYIENIMLEFKSHIAGDIDEINIQALIKDENESKWILIRGKGIADDNDEMKKIYGIVLDISNIKEQEEYIEHLANHDYLTDLPNRMKFMNIISSELVKGTKGAILLFDIDDFKNINDTLGHMNGDELLKQIAARLNRIKDKNMLVSRIGGDEFLVLLTDVSTVEEVNPHAQNIKNLFTEKFLLEGTENYINFSMGITFFPKDSDNIIQLIMNADTAMYHVKHNGKNNYIYYHDDMNKEIKTKKEIETILRNALKEDGFCLYYQPQVETQTGNICGFEALLRLKEYNIGPALFIPIAEETGHIIEIGRWVAKQAIRQIAEWRDKGFEEKVIAINYSSKQLRDKGYIAYIRELLKEYNIKSKYIEIEITEGILIENNPQTMEFLQELKKYGFKISLDDFGTGYSSLNYLTFIPVNKIKLDKSINDKFLNLDNNMVMDSLISLAHSLNLKITAEGIEDWDSFFKLKNSGCDYIQGYLFSKPLPKEVIEKIYNQRFNIEKI